MKYILLLVASLISILAWGQDRTFAGRVIDNDTKEGIPFCVVKVKDHNKGVYSDENGRFAFTADADSARSFIFFCLGYTRLELTGEQLNKDSVIVRLKRDVTSLKEVVVKNNNGKKRTQYLGKKKSKHVSDCYQKYGEEDALFLKADKAHDGILKDVSIFITNEGVPDSKFRVHVYKKDPVTNLPAEELTDSNLIVHATKGNDWVRADLSNKYIHIEEGVFISVEWISGYGNSTMALQSLKHTEVDGHNGQVLGLTKNSWKGKGAIKYMYHRDAFNSAWKFNYSPLLCPMIYGRYYYYKH